MKKYAITFRKLKSICNHRTRGVYAHIVENSYACARKLNMDWVHSEDPVKFIECKESNCPILLKCGRVTT